jgi:hypothetical protein
VVISKTSEAGSSSIESEAELLGANLSRYELGGRGIEFSWKLQNNGKEEIRL